MHLNLDSTECIELEIIKTKQIPLRNEDWIKIPFFVFFSMLLYFIMENFLFKNFSKGFHAYFIFFLIIYIYIVFVIIRNYYKRYLVGFKWKYIITNKRLLIINHKNLIENSFYYNDFPKIKLQYGIPNDYIIIGEKEPFLEESNSLLNKRVGINFSENDLILYNIESVENIYNTLKSKIILT